LEHLNSTHLITNRNSFLTDGGYKGFLGLVAHEYFHLWNVKRIRPKALGPFDYTNENYTNLLYVSEGFTSYYDDYFVRRTNIYSPDQYLGVIAANINAIENTPGTRIQSATESSFDAWIKQYRPNENSNNMGISYYSVGCVIANMLDFEILVNTKGEKSLDDVYNLLWNEYYKKQNRGFTDEEFKKACEAIAGKNLDQFFNDHVKGTKMFDYPKYFSMMGMRIVDKNANSNEAYLGATTTSSSGKVIVTSVLKATTAYDGGINVNDELLGIDNFRIMDANSVNFLVSKYSPGETMNLMIARDGVIMTLPVKVKRTNQVNYVVTVDPNRTPEQEMLYNKWMYIKK
jgi:predicted metalloprotease with PDZ domain